MCIQTKISLNYLCVLQFIVVFLNFKPVSPFTFHVMEKLLWTPNTISISLSLSKYYLRGKITQKLAAITEARNYTFKASFSKTHKHEPNKICAPVFVSYFQHKDNIWLVLFVNSWIKNNVIVNKSHRVCICCYCRFARRRYFAHAWAGVCYRNSSKSCRSICPPTCGSANF